MRSLKNTYINWFVLSLICLTCLYFILSNNYLSLVTQSSEHSYLFSNVNINTNQEEEIISLKNKESDISETKIKKKTDGTEGNLWRSMDNVNSSQDKVIDLIKWIENYSHSEHFKTVSSKRILVFNGFENYYGTNGQLNCPFNETALKQKCIIKEDKLLEVSNYFGYDAFVDVRNWRHVIYDRKIPAVKHIYYIEESPFVVKYADLSVNNAILASYWRGSDLVLPYGHFTKFKDKYEKGSNKENKRNYAKGKTKFAAIVVSNCEAINDRLSYVKKLQKYIPVDVYGSCGTKECDDCFELVKKEYKFYLAFEKANCRDYITEKFWQNALSFDAIPVVMGAHPRDYIETAPPNSYIHVEDFKSPKDLADYLLTLDKNDALYNEYFDWKNLGRVEFVWKEFFCRVCGILFYSDIHPNPSWPEKSTWKSVNHCLPFNQWYWNRSQNDE